MPTSIGVNGRTWSGASSRIAASMEWIGYLLALLGEPTRTDKWDGSEMIYVLGPDASMFPIDNEWLLIELDQQGRVAGYQVRSD